MNEFNLQFKDLVEGKRYKLYEAGSDYTIKDNLLYSYESNNFSLHSLIKINSFRFKEIKELPKLTQLGIDLLKSLKKEYNVNYIARDVSSDLFLYKNKPKKCDYDYEGFGGNKYIGVFGYLFPYITFESGSINIQELLDSQDNYKKDDNDTIHDIKFINGNKYKIDFESEIMENYNVIVDDGDLIIINEGKSIFEIVQPEYLLSATVTKIK